MAYDARILCDSIANGVRLTTIQVTFPRFVLAEKNTHRALCLAGDSILEFDLPAGKKGGKYRRLYTMRLDEFVDKWINGARRIGANPKRFADVSWIEDDRLYSSHEIAARLGMVSPTAIHKACRDGVVRAQRGEDGRTWMVLGMEVRRWRKTIPEHTRFDMKSKLSAMRIRQLNETTGDIQWSYVKNVSISGTKKVYEIRAGEFSVAGSADHRVLTTTGWKTIGDLQTGIDLIVVRKFGKRDDDRMDPLRLKKIDGVWRCQWQRQIAAEMRAEDPLCRRCRNEIAVEIHHVVPVHIDPKLAFTRSNVTFLCDMCHDAQHEEQRWQGGTYLYGSAVMVEEISLRGEEMTYDLEISGEFPNFLANGIVVHNSRNSASSRAIPVEKQIARVMDDPFVPAAFAANKKGMQAGDALSDEDQQFARDEWLDARDYMVSKARRMAERDVHKQWANRLIEPFAWHTAIVTATEWANFFALRCSPMAQPEIRTAAEMMRDVMNASTPQELGKGDWHLPLVVPDDIVETRFWGEPQQWAKISAARCARVSYLTHDGKRDIDADLALYERLTTSGHWSPLEHAARPATYDDAWDVCAKMGITFNQSFADHEHFNLAKMPFGNLRGWMSLRKMMPGEDVFVPPPQQEI